jgi:hypothetical protein
LATAIMSSFRSQFPPLHLLVGMSMVGFTDSLEKLRLSMTTSCEISSGEKSHPPFPAVKSIHLQILQVSS